MSGDAAPNALLDPAAWPVLGLHERRVLGVLIEKAKTTPDAYPLSLNALTVGSNQKSNRDPVLDLNDLDVEEALAVCQKLGLAFKITGGRVDRWKHNLYEAWRINKQEIAILGELLLRGAQTEGELRSRASRMEPFDDLDALRAALKPLATRKLVVYLGPEGRRGTMLTHGFCSPKELERARAAQPQDSGDDERPAARAVPAAATPPSAPVRDQLVEEVATLRQQVVGLGEQVTALSATVAELQTQLQNLKAALGA